MQRVLISSSELHGHAGSVTAGEGRSFIRLQNINYKEHKAETASFAEAQDLAIDMPVYIELDYRTISLT